MNLQGRTEAGRGRALRRRSPAAGIVVVAGVAMVAFLLATQPWDGWQEGVDRLDARDVESYRPMAEAAPDLPSDRIGSVYAQRFAVHYLVGLLVQLPGVDLLTGYRLALVLSIAAAVGLMYLIWGRLSASTLMCVVALGIVLLNPFTFRPYLISPGGVQDVVFVVAVAVLILAVMAARPALAPAACVLAVAARQTALLVVPVAAVWWFLASRPRGPGVPSDQRETYRWLVPAAMLVLTAMSWLAIRLLVSSFTEVFEPRIPDDTVLTDLSNLPSGASELATHLLRSLLPVLVPLAALVGLLTVPSARRALAGNTAMLGALAVAAAILVQPVVLSPSFPGLAHNEQRLGALAVLPLAVALTAAMIAVPDRGLRPGSAAVMLGVLGVASLHHVFTPFVPLNTATFVLIQVLAGLAIAVIVRRDFVRVTSPAP